MSDEAKLKQVKAKLYNLKNGIEGIIPMIDSGVIPAEKVGDAVASLAAKAVEELTAVGG